MRLIYLNKIVKLIIQFRLGEKCKKHIHVHFLNTRKLSWKRQLRIWIKRVRTPVAQLDPREAPSTQINNVFKRLDHGYIVSNQAPKMLSAIIGGVSVSSYNKSQLFV